MYCLWTSQLKHFRRWKYTECRYPGSNVIFICSITCPWSASVVKDSSSQGSTFQFYCQLSTQLKWQTNKELINSCQQNDRFFSCAAVWLELGWNDLFYFCYFPNSKPWCGMRCKLQFQGILEMFFLHLISLYPKHWGGGRREWPEEMTIYLVNLQWSAFPFSTKDFFFLQELAFK